MAPLKILQLSHKMPYPIHDGGSYSIYNTALGLLSNAANLKVLAINSPKNWVDENCFPSEYIKKTRFESVTIDTRLRPVTAFCNLFGKQSYFVERFWSEDYVDKLTQILKSEEFDIIQLEHSYLCLYLNTIRKYSRAKVILRPQNVENEVWRRCQHHYRNPIKKFYLHISCNRLEKFERKIASEVDGIIAISAEDARTFADYTPNTPVVEVPLGFNFNANPPYNPEKQTDFPVFYHLGSMDWMPNYQGLKWFIEEVIPFIIKEYPQFDFRIAGKKMPAWFYHKQSRNLRVDGEVNDSIKYQEDKSIMIVPLLSGGGIRAKIIEGMALGKTIISTTIGAEGIAYTNRENILIADTKEEVARQILICRKSPERCKEIGRNAHLLALEYYDCHKTAGKMMAFYETF